MLYILLGNVAEDLSDEFLVHLSAEGIFSSNNVSKKSNLSYSGTTNHHTTVICSCLMTRGQQYSAQI